MVHQHKRPHLGPEPLQQFSNQPGESPATVVPAEDGLPGNPTHVTTVAIAGISCLANF